MNKEKMINSVIDRYSEIELISKAVKNLFGGEPESRFVSTIWKVFDTLVNHTSAAIGDEDDWLSWYVFGNDCGRDRMKAGFDVDLRKIKTVRDLIWLIDHHKGGA